MSANPALPREALWLPTGVPTSRRFWDDDVGGVVFDHASGDTHFLDVLSFELLELVEEAPLRLSEACAQLLGVPATEEEAFDAKLRVNTAFRHLFAMGLVQESAEQ